VFGVLHPRTQTRCRPRPCQITSGASGQASIECSTLPQVAHRDVDVPDAVGRTSPACSRNRVIARAPIATPGRCDERRQHGSSSGSAYASRCRRIHGVSSPHAIHTVRPRTRQG
jgi:hypothetical protein